MNTLLPGVEKRLQHRYGQLVEEHTGLARSTASGPRLLPQPLSPQAAAMAAWRFFHHPQVTFSRLSQPLLQAAQEAASQHCHHFALVPLDWSKLDYATHASKADRLVLGRSKELGYKLLSALLIGDQDGQPLAPLCQQLLTARGLFSSRFDRPRPPRSTLDELAPVMQFVRGLPLGKPPVFFIDAEADSVYHYRQWQRRGFLFLVRADKERFVRLNHAGGREMRLPAVARRLQRQQAFQQVREVDYHGERVGQYVAEQAVVLTRPAHLQRVVRGKVVRRLVAGAPLALRLVITELRSEAGVVLERWYLLTNVSGAVPAATIALWYYWRWTVETYFKLLKSAGQAVEHWQQETGEALLKRLLVASMACVLAWRLGMSEAPLAAEARELVMRLSGRQREAGKEYTMEGLLAGIWVLLALEAVLDQMPASRLCKFARFVRAGSVGTKTGPPPRRRAS
jgi:DDE family transposase